MKWIFSVKVYLDHHFSSLFIKNSDFDEFVFDFRFDEDLIDTIIVEYFINSSPKLYAVGFSKMSELLNFTDGCDWIRK